MININLILLTLEKLKGVGRKTLQDIPLDKIKSVKDMNDLYQLYKEIKESKRKIEEISIDDLSNIYYEIDRKIEESKKLDIYLINYYETSFPKMLLDIKNPPIYIFYKGNLNALYMKGIAVIGTRHPTDYAVRIGERIGKRLTENNLSVISGLALGCDAAAHIGCVSANGIGIAILPSPLNNIVPASNKKLAEDLLKNNGCIISEYIIGTEVDKYKFVDRDRLQTALAKGVLVIETGEKGGTWHAINEALKYKKPIACIDFSFKKNYYQNNKNSLGNKKLIDNNLAMGLSSLDDITEYLNKILGTKPVEKNFENISLF